jgi:preprotein translocase subunit YajC
MKMRSWTVAVLMAGMALAGLAQDATQQPGEGQRQGRGFGTGMGRGMGMGMGRGVAGTVTEVASDHFTIKNEQGETWTVHYSANTRVMKQPPRAANAQPGEGERQMPQQIKATDIKVGDVIAAGGEVDQAGKSVGAMFVMQVDPERAKQMREMQANFGKTWLMGRVTAINETTVTLHSGVDNADHSFTADENTTFRRRRDPITLGDIQVGDNVRVEGAMKDGKFLATSVGVMAPPMQGGPARPRGDVPPQ